MKINESDQEDKEVTDFGTMPDGQPSSWGPTGKDGGPMPHMANPGAPVSTPEFDRKNSKCLQDCRHYMTSLVWMEVGNASLPEGFTPGQYHTACLVQSGVSRELSRDAPVMDCNQWSPYSITELTERTRNIKQWKEQELRRQETEGDTNADGS